MLVVLDQKTRNEHYFDLFKVNFKINEAKCTGLYLISLSLERSKIKFFFHHRKSIPLT